MAAALVGSAPVAICGKSHHERFESSVRRSHRLDQDETGVMKGAISIMKRAIRLMKGAISTMKAHLGEAVLQRPRVRQLQLQSPQTRARAH